jgi:hypothetical protein
VIATSAVECPSGAAITDIDSGPYASYSLSEGYDASDQNVGRLALYHMSTAATPSFTGPLIPCFARVALLMVGEECQLAGCAASLAETLESAAVTDAWDPATGVWDVTVDLPPIASAATGPRQLHVRRVIGGDAGAGVVSEVNDAAVAFLPLQIGDAAAPAP